MLAVLSHPTIDTHLCLTVRTAVDDILEGINAEGDQTTPKPAAGENEIKMISGKLCQSQQTNTSFRGRGEE